MADTGLQRIPEFVWLGNRENSVVQHREYPDGITGMLLRPETFGASETLCPLKRSHSSWREQSSLYGK